MATKVISRLSQLRDVLPDPVIKKRRIVWSEEEWNAMAADMWRLTLLNPTKSIKWRVEQAQSHVLGPDRRRTFYGPEMAPLIALMKQCAADAVTFLNRRSQIERDLVAGQKWRDLKVHLLEAPEQEIENCTRTILERVRIERFLAELSPDEILSVVPLETLVVAVAKRQFRDAQSQQIKQTEILALVNEKLAALAPMKHNGVSGMNGHKSAHEFVAVVFGLPDRFDVALRRMVLAKVADTVKVVRVETSDLNPESIPPSTNVVACWSQAVTRRQLEMIRRRTKQVGLAATNVVMETGTVDVFLNKLLACCPLRVA